MVYSDYVKQRILFYRHLGKSYDSITNCLAKQGCTTTKADDYKFVRRYEETAMILRRPGSGLAKKVSGECEQKSPEGDIQSYYDNAVHHTFGELLT